MGMDKRNIKQLMVPTNELNIKMIQNVYLVGLLISGAISQAHSGFTVHRIHPPYRPAVED